MAFRIPYSAAWNMSHANEFDGDIVDCRNFSFDDEGYATLTSRMVPIFGNDDDEDFGILKRVSYFDGEYKIITNDESFTLSTMASTAALEGDVAAPAPGGDQEYFNSHLYGSVVTTSSYDLKYWDSSANNWVDLSLTFGSSSTIANRAGAPLKVFKSANKMAYGALNTVKLVKSDNTLDSNILALPSELIVTSIDYNNSNLYVGALDQNNEEAYMFVWNGSTAIPQYGFPAGGSQIFSVRTYKSSVVIVTSSGQVLRFTANGFDVLDNFPIYYEKVAWADGLVNFDIARHRSLYVDGDTLLISAKGEAGDGSLLPGMRSGIWCYDPLAKLCHKYGFGSSKRVTVGITSSVVSAPFDTITVGSGPYAKIVTGTPFMYDAKNNAEIGGLDDKQVYYAIKVGSDAIRAAMTRNEALAGTFVDLTTTAVGTQAVIFYPEQGICDEVAESTYYVEAMPPQSVSDSYYFNRIVAGASVTGPTGTGIVDTLQVLVPNLPNVGYLVSKKFRSSGAEDKYTAAVVKYENLYAGSSIIVKYRTQESEHFPILSESLNSTSLPEGTWIDSVSFQSPSENMRYVLAGDEISILSGSGCGHIRHVSSISQDSGTYTVILDEAMPHVNAAEAFSFKAERWTKLETITESSGTGYFKPTIGENSKFIQVKLEVRGTNVKIESVDVVNTVHKPLYN